MGTGPIMYVAPTPADAWPWIFRRDPFFVLVAMVGIWLGIVAGIWLAQNF